MCGPKLTVKPRGEPRNGGYAPAQATISAATPDGEVAVGANINPNAAGSGIAPTDYFGQLQLGAVTSKITIFGGGAVGFEGRAGKLNFPLLGPTDFGVGYQRSLNGESRISGDIGFKLDDRSSVKIGAFQKLGDPSNEREASLLYDLRFGPGPRRR